MLLTTLLSRRPMKLEGTRVVCSMEQQDTRCAAWEPKMLRCTGMLLFASILCLPSPRAQAKDKNPYKRAGSSPVRTAGSRSGALFTTEKKRPESAERNAVFEDYRI